jgi:hypothetical protein
MLGMLTNNRGAKRDRDVPEAQLSCKCSSRVRTQLARVAGPKGQDPEGLIVLRGSDGARRCRERQTGYSATGFMRRPAPIPETGEASSVKLNGPDEMSVVTGEAVGLKQRPCRGKRETVSPCRLAKGRREQSASTLSG